MLADEGPALELLPWLRLLKRQLDSVFEVPLGLIDGRHLLLAVEHVLPVDVLEEGVLFELLGVPLGAQPSPRVTAQQLLD